MLPRCTAESLACVRPSGVRLLASYPMYVRLLRLPEILCTFLCLLSAAPSVGPTRRQRRWRASRQADWQGRQAGRQAFRHMWRVAWPPSLYSLQWMIIKFVMRTSSSHNCEEQLLTLPTFIHYIIVNIDSKIVCERMEMKQTHTLALTHACGLSYYWSNSIHCINFLF